MESRHVEWQTQAMTQIATLAGGGLVASASLLWPKAPLPNPRLIAIAWGALALATIAAVAANYLSATGNAFRTLHLYQQDVLPLVSPDERGKVERWIGSNQGKANRRTKTSYVLGVVAPWSFAIGVVLLAAWSVSSIWE